TPVGAARHDHHDAAATGPQLEMTEPVCVGVTGGMAHRAEQLYLDARDEPCQPTQHEAHASHGQLMHGSALRIAGFEHHLHGIPPLRNDIAKVMSSSMLKKQPITKRLFRKTSGNAPMSQ